MNVYTTSKVLALVFASAAASASPSQQGITKPQESGKGPSVSVDFSAGPGVSIGVDGTVGDPSGRIGSDKDSFGIHIRFGGGGGGGSNTSDLNPQISPEPYHLPTKEPN